MKLLKEFDFKKFLKSHYWIFALLVVFLVALYIRMIPGYQMQYPRLQHEADCYLIYRLGEFVVENGHIPANDTYIGYGTLLNGYDQTRSHVITYLTYPAFYWILNPLFGVSFYWVAIWIPAFLGALQVLFMFFLARELFDKKVGLLAATFLAVSPGILMRVSAGFIEKEPIGGLLMIIGLWLFVKSLKVKEVKKSLFHYLKLPFIHPDKHQERIKMVRIISYGIIAGLVLAIMAGGWGGIRIPLLVIGLFVFAALMINKYSSHLSLSYLSTFITFFAVSRIFEVSPHLGDLEVWSNLIVIGLLVIRFGIEKYKLVKKEYIPFTIPALVCLGIVGFGVYAYVNVDTGAWFANFVAMTESPLAFNVIGSTVAEQQTTGGFFANSVSNFGTDYAISAYKLPEFIRYFSVFYFSILGVLLMFYLYIFKSRAYEYIFCIVFFTFCAYVASTTVRLNYVLGFPVAITAAFFVAKASEFVIKQSHKVKIKTQYITAVIGALIGIMIITNMASAYVVSVSTTPGLEEEWYQALLWLKDNTDTKDVTLEWWDYGYWFQYIAKRRTITDGGYHNPYPLQDIAKFYTEPLSNNSLKLLKNFSVDYVMVSPDLIGKFGALSKIANWGAKIDTLPVFYLTNRYQQGNKTLMEFSIGDQQILVTFSVVQDNETTSIANITAVYKYGVNQAYIRDIGLGDQVIRSDKPNAISAMVYFAGNAIIFIPGDAEECLFVRLYLFNGKGLEDLFEKVYDNLGMKIYKVKYENFPPMEVYNPDLPPEDRIS